MLVCVCVCVCVCACVCLCVCVCVCVCVYIYIIPVRYTAKPCGGSIQNNTKKKTRYTAKPCDGSMKNLQKPKSSLSARSKTRSLAAPLAQFLTKNKKSLYADLGIGNIIGH